MELFGQVTMIDPNTTANWFSVVIQGGAFALVVYIVAVLYPKSTREIRDEREKRDGNFQSMINLMQTSFQERNNTLAMALREQTKELGDDMKELGGDIKEQGRQIERALQNICGYERRDPSTRTRITDRLEPNGGRT